MRRVSWAANGARVGQSESERSVVAGANRTFFVVFSLVIELHLSSD